jgi:hypothetical protein
LCCAADDACTAVNHSPLSSVTKACPMDTQWASQPAHTAGQGACHDGLITVEYYSAKQTWLSGRY